MPKAPLFNTLLLNYHSNVQQRDKTLILIGILYVWSLLLSITLQTALLIIFLLYFILFELKASKTLLKNRVLQAFLMFYFISFFTSLFSPYRLYAIKKISGVIFDTLVPFVMGYIITTHNLEGRVKKHGLISFVILSTLSVVLYLYSKGGFSPLLNRHGILTGFLGGKLTYAGVLSAMGGIIFERIPYKDGILALLLLIISTGINTSRSYIFGILFSVFVIGLLNLKKYYKYLLLTLFTLIVLVMSFPKTYKRFKTTNPKHPDTSIKIRLDLWKMGVKILNKHPVFGIGFETWPRVADSMVNKYGSHLLRSTIIKDSPNARAIRGHFHNTYLEMAINGGIPLLVFYLYLIFTMLKDAILLDEPMKYAFLFMFSIFIFAGFFEYNFSDAEVAHAFFFFSGIYLQKAKV